MGSLASEDKAHKSLLKVGQTTRDVKQGIAEQLKTATIKNYKIELDESAERDDGTPIGGEGGAGIRHQSTPLSFSGSF